MQRWTEKRERERYEQTEDDTKGVPVGEGKRLYGVEVGVTAGEMRRDDGPGVGWADRAPIAIVSPSAHTQARESTPESTSEG